MRRSLLTLSPFILILAMVGCGQRQAPPPPSKPVVPAFQTFQSPAGDFELTYATANWEVEKDTSVALSLQHKTEPATLQLIESDLGQPLKKSDLKMFSGITIASVKEGFKNFKEVGKADTTFAGQPAHQFTFTCTESDTLMMMRMIFFSSGTKAYALIIGAEAERYHQIAPDVEKMLGTFKVASSEPAKP